MMDCYMKRYGVPPIVIDTFNRANGNIGNADSGQAWLTGSSPTTTWVVDSNVAKRASVSASIYDVAHIDCGKTDVTVSANITMTENSQGTRLMARIFGSSIDYSMSLYIHSSGQISIIKRISGTDTVLGSGTFSFASGSTYACVFTCRGNDFTASIDGVLKVSVTDDNALKTNTKVGMFLPLATSAASDYFDNFTVKG